MKTTALLVTLGLVLAGCASETDEEKAPTEEVKAPVGQTVKSGTCC